VDDKHRICPVANSIEDRTHYIKCLDNTECYYQISIDGLYYKCSCPVRGEIYNKIPKIKNELYILMLIIIP
jgi:hypothetical protein